jgi:hypothetical protein
LAGDANRLPLTIDYSLKGIIGTYALKGINDMVRELEMTPTAYMDIPRGWGHPVRVVPRTVAILGHSRESVMAAGYSVINRIMATIDAIGGIVWWRLHPEVEEREQPHPDTNPTTEEAEDWHKFKFRARIATSPELSDQFWDGLTTKEGDIINLTAAKVWAQLNDPLAGAESELYSEKPDFEADLPGSRETYGPGLMRDLRAMTLRGGGLKEADEPADFGCAQMVTAGIEKAGATPIAATIGNAKPKRKTSSNHAGSRTRPRVRGTHGNPAKGRGRFRGGR